MQAGAASDHKEDADAALVMIKEFVRASWVEDWRAYAGDLAPPLVPRLPLLPVLAGTSGTPLASVPSTISLPLLPLPSPTPQSVASPLPSESNGDSESRKRSRGPSSVGSSSLPLKRAALEPGVAGTKPPVAKKSTRAAMPTPEKGCRWWVGVSILTVFEEADWLNSAFPVTN